MARLLPSRMDPRRIVAVEYYLSGMTTGEIAEKIGVTRGTVRSWSDSPEFKRELERHMVQRLEAASKRLQALIPDAIETLAAIMMDPDEKGASRVAAAREILDRAGIRPVVDSPPARAEVTTVDDLRHRVRQATLRLSAVSVDAQVLDEGEE